MQREALTEHGHGVVCEGIQMVQAEHSSREPVSTELHHFTETQVHRSLVKTFVVKLKPRPPIHCKSAVLPLALSHFEFGFASMFS